MPGKGNVILGTQNKGLLRISPENKVDTFRLAFKNKLLNSFVFTKADYVLIGAHDGLYVYHYSIDDGFNLVSKFSELDYLGITSIKISSKENYFWIGTEDSGFWLLEAKSNDFSNYILKQISANFELQYENVQSFTENSRDELYISTFGSGIYKFSLSSEGPIELSGMKHYSTSNGLTNNYIKQVFLDWEGNTWIATYGEGVAFSKDDALTFHYQNIEGLGGNIISLTETDNELWLGGKSVVLKVDKETNKFEVFNIRNGLPDDDIVALFSDGDGNIWAGSNKSGLYKIPKGSKRAVLEYKSANSLENNINSISGNGKKVFVCTKGGILFYDCLKCCIHIIL